MGRFANDTAVSLGAPGRYDTELKAGWRIGPIPNGGYLLTIVGRAISEALEHKDPLSINAFYLAPSALGPAQVNVEPLKTAGNTHFASADLVQNGELKIRATAAYTTLENLKGEHWLGNSPPEAPAFEDCTEQRISHLEIFEHVDCRVVGGYELFQTGQPTGEGEFVAWLQHADGATIEPLDLLMMVDVMPPAAFNVVGLVGWVPTVELTVQVRKHPAPGPVLARVKAQYLTNGVIETDADIWDSAGDLVAISRQTMKVRIKK